MGSGTSLQSRFVFRVRFIALGFVLIGVFVVIRLYSLQIFHGADYTLKADRQFISPSSSLFDRGHIYFRDKTGMTIAAATLTTGVSIAAEPQKIADKEALWKELEPYLPLSREEFMEHLSRPEVRYVVLAQHLPEKTGTEIRDKEQKGVVVAQDRWRFYPAGSLAARVVGLVAFNDEKLEGRYGLERYYEPILRREGSDLYANFFVELFSGIKGALGGAEHGDLITTIEPSVQAELERALGEYEAEWHPTVAGGIVMDPKTGAIYAMALAPSFDLNNFSQVSIEKFGNPLVEGVYEMGSIIKPLTMAAGLDAGIVTPSSTYRDRGSIEVDGKKISNFDGYLVTCQKQSQKIVFKARSP